MILYNLKIALRNIFRNKVFSAINILGLSLGLTGVILIFLWVFNELNYDRFYKKSDRIYLLINRNIDDNGNSIDYVESPPPMADYLADNYPEIISTARVEYFYNGGLIEKGKDIFKEKGAAVDQSFLDIFDIEFKYGSNNNAFSNSESIVISENIAKRYFDDANPVGEILKVKGYGNEYKTVMIRGVYKDFPNNSSLKFDFMIPFSLEEKMYSDNWNVAIYATFVLLDKKNDFTGLNKRVSSIYKEVTNDEHYSSYLFPFEKIHLHSDLSFFNNSNQGNVKLIYIMTFIALIIIVIACINYMNLATARSIKKLKEVSIKKILGASRSSLANEFLTETILLTLISFHVGIILIEIFRPLFNQITGKNITINYFDPHLWLNAIYIIVIIGLISAIYPFLYLKSHRPVRFLSWSNNQRTNKARAKKILVIVQFTISIILIIFSAVIIKQLNFISTKDLGFNRDNVIVINSSDLSEKEKVFKNEILKNPDVISVSIGKSPISGAWPDAWSWEGRTSENRLGVISIFSDSDYLKTLNIKLLQGRYFNKDFVDENYIVINKEFANMIGSDHVIGKEITHRNQKYEVIGITENVYSNHFSEKVKPIAFLNKPTHKFLIKVRNEKVKATADYLKSVFNKIVPDRPFEYITLEAQFNLLHKNELKKSKLFGFFSVLAIFISCLGLLGISIFTAEQKTKEIGIHKTLGATSGKIVSMLNYEFIKLVFIAFIIACPIAYYIANNWLQNFVYKTELSWWIFALTGVFVIFITLLTVSWFSLKAARQNPVLSLRYE